MCGIAGFLRGQSRALPLAETIQGMVGRLKHRGPDGQGAWLDEPSGVALGHTRLAITDFSERGRQPMISPSGRWVLTLNGEIYNHARLRARLAQSGVFPQGTSDAEVFLLGIEAWGLSETLRESEGMFAFALWDAHTRSLTLARDRFGEKTIYYGVLSGAFVFASELKALRGWPGFPPPLDQRALKSFFQFGRIDSPRCVFSGLLKLPPGHMVTVSERDAGRGVLPEPACYWRVPFIVHESEPVGGSEDLVAVFSEKLHAIVEQRLPSTVPTGIFLSGGLDSTLVTALAVRCRPASSLMTFSVGGFGPRFDENPIADRLARFLGTEHRSLQVDANDIRATLSLLPEIYDEPFADSSQILQLLLARAATDAGRKVCLSGDGADEVFGGYARHLLGPKIWRFCAAVPASVRRILARLLLLPAPGTLDRLIAPVRAALPGAWPLNYFGLKVQRLAWAAMAASPFDLYQRLAGIGASRGLLHSDVVSPPLAAGDECRSEEAFAGPVTEGSFQYWDQTRYLPEDILVKIDRAAMRFGLETRLPFLDTGLVEWAARLPRSAKFQGGKGKWLVRELLKKLVPEHLWERPKMGLTLPLRDLLRHELRDWAESWLSVTALSDAGIFDVSAVRRLWREHSHGSRDWNYAPWAVLCFQTWHRHLAIGPT